MPQVALANLGSVSFSSMKSEISDLWHSALKDESWSEVRNTLLPAPWMLGSEIIFCEEMHHAHCRLSKPMHERKRLILHCKRRLKTINRILGATQCPDAHNCNIACLNGMQHSDAACHHLAWEARLMSMTVMQQVKEKRGARAHAYEARAELKTSTAARKNCSRQAHF